MIPDKKEVTVPALQKGRYRHFKGNLYEVVDVALHSETMEPHVVYRALYGAEKQGEGGLWIRPLSMFFETVERDGRVFKRFEYVDKEG